MKLRDLFGAEDRSQIEKWCRAHAQIAYLGQHTALARVLGEFLMYVDTRDISLAPHLLMNGYWEMWVTQAIVDYVLPGMRCIDVGANFGYYTLLLKELSGERGQVTAYEPGERAHELLTMTLMVNGGHAPIALAISDAAYLSTLYTSPMLFGSASLRPSKGLSPGKSVDVTTLDLMHPEGAIDFVKIDAQGYELAVLRGMRGIIGRSPKIAIALEFTPEEHEDAGQALEEIRAMGFKLRTIGTDGQVRPVSLEDAAKPDTGDHRMLWLEK